MDQAKQQQPPFYGKWSEVLDDYFAFLQTKGGMTYPADLIPEAMLDQERESDFEGIGCWTTIPSTITEEEILELEQFYAHKLPASFKQFLQYKFYLDLEVGGHGWRIFDLLPTKRLGYWMDEMNWNYAEQISANYLPFGESDHLILCLNANEPGEDYNYPVGMYDPFEESFEVLAKDFSQFGSDVEAWLADWKSHRK